MVTTPERHFPSYYASPSAPPVLAQSVTTADGARIATFIYAPASNVVEQGEYVLMLHGNGEDHTIFGQVIDATTEAGYHVLAIDSRAQGKSTRGKERLTYELMAADALVAADALGIKTFHVLGFSDGGIEGLLLARDYPERVLSATLLGANLTPEGVIEDDWDMEGTAETNEAWAAWCKEADPKVDTSLLTPTPEEALQTAELLRLMLEEPHIDAGSLTCIACPVTVMVGEFDCIRDDETVAMARTIPAAKLVVVPGCGHTLPKHAPREVAAELLETISRA